MTSPPGQLPDDDLDGFESERNLIAPGDAPAMSIDDAATTHVDGPKILPDDSPTMPSPPTDVSPTAFPSRRIPLWAMLAAATLLWLGGRWAGEMAVTELRARKAATRPAYIDTTAMATNRTRPAEQPGGQPSAPAPLELGASSTNERPMPAGLRPRLLPIDLVQHPVFSPSFGPDGTSLLFHAEKGSSSALMRVDLTPAGQAASVVTLLDDGARNFHVRMSPDGRHIAFDSDRDGERGVYVADVDGTHIQRISGRNYAAVPTWSPDGTKIAFLRAGSPNPKVWNLWVMDLSPKVLRPVSAYTGGQVWAGSWFPDSRTICYSHETQLVVTDVRTRRAVRYSTPVLGRLVRTPAVSPDGQRVVFQVYRDGLWILNLHDGSMRQLLADRSAEEFAWSPDGQRLAFHSRRDGAWRLWMMPVA